MSAVDIEHLRTWIGRERTVEDVVTPRLALSLDAVLDVERPMPAGDPAPIGIHWCLAPDIVPMRGIGADGHPARGGFLPPVPFPRRMWAGGEVEFFDPLLVGDTVRRRSVIEEVTLKTGRSGEMIFVTIRHHYETARGVALVERQDIVYRALDTTAPPPSGTSPDPVEETADVSRTIDADPVLLFRYSAITFNGHRIHYDQPYVTGEEHYPGLVFHGPLQATLLLSLAADSLARPPSGFQFRSLRPLFAGGRPQLNLRNDADGLALWIADDGGDVTMRARAR
jgi:3-methylfumaryl-CoA hydratase